MIKRLIAVTALAATMALAQSTVPAPVAVVTPSGPAQFVGGGIFYNQYSAPNLSGYGVYAVRVASSTYNYNVVDFTSVKVHPFSVQTSIETGVAQKITTLGRFDIYGLVGAGAAAAGTGSGTNVGAAFTGGGMATTKVHGNWSLQIPVRVLKTTLSGTQYVIGLGLGWGQ